MAATPSKKTKSASTPVKAAPPAKAPRPNKIGDFGTHIIKGETVRSKVVEVDKRANGTWLTVQRGKGADAKTNVIRTQAFTRA